MSTRSKQEYFAVLRERYRSSASKTERTKVIDEAIANTGLHRKSVIRALNAEVLTPEIPRLGRPRLYSGECFELLKRFYRATEYLCADKLKAMLPVLMAEADWEMSEELKKKLGEMSPASMDRYLGPYRKIERRRRNSSTRPGSRLFKKLVPLKSLTLVSPRCGYLEADTVAHCGGSMAGDFIFSLTITDTFSGWTENRAVFGKSAKAVLPAIESIHRSLPFEIVSVNVDNGSEFLNHRTYEYFKILGELRTIPFPMTRSRSYQKNDNCHVEQKNWTHVRQLFGYDRFEFRELTVIMDEIYAVQNQMQNFFIPQFKLQSKVRVGAQIKKQYDKPTTPYERILNDTKTSDAAKKRLRETYATLRYFELQRHKEELLTYFIETHRRLRSENQALPQGSLLTAAR